MKARIHKNGNINITLNKRCVECGLSLWDIVEILNNKTILKCQKCDSEMRVTVKFDDMRAELVAREIVDEIKEVIDNSSI